MALRRPELLHGDPWTHLHRELYGSDISPDRRRRITRAQMARRAAIELDYMRRKVNHMDSDIYWLKEKIKRLEAKNDSFRSSNGT